MSIQTQLIPHKHVRFGDSLLSIAGLIRTRLLDRDQTLDELWIRLNKICRETDQLEEVSFSRLILAVDVLFALRVLDQTNDGLLRSSIGEVG